MYANLYDVWSASEKALAEDAEMPPRIINQMKHRAEADQWLARTAQSLRPAHSRGHSFHLKNWMSGGGLTFHANTNGPWVFGQYTCVALIKSARCSIGTALRTWIRCSWRNNQRERGHVLSEMLGWDLSFSYLVRTMVPDKRAFSPSVVFHRLRWRIDSGERWRPSPRWQQLRSRRMWPNRSSA